MDVRRIWKSRSNLFKTWPIAIKLIDGIRDFKRKILICLEFEYWDLMPSKFGRLKRIIVQF